MIGIRHFTKREIVCSVTGVLFSQIEKIVERALAFAYAFFFFFFFFFFLLMLFYRVHVSNLKKRMRAH